jgi:hypothetical protein
VLMLGELSLSGVLSLGKGQGWREAEGKGMITLVGRDEFGRVVFDRSCFSF